MERKGGAKDRGALSQWRGRKIIAEMIETKVMLEVQVVDVGLPPNQLDRDRDAGRGTTKTRNPADLYQPDHPSSLLPHRHHHCHPQIQQKINNKT